MKKSTKKVLIWGLLATIIPSITFPIVACSTTKTTNNQNYLFDGQNFNSEDELNRYAHDNLSQQNTTTVANNQFWTLNLNGQTSKYSDPYLLKNVVDQSIEPIDVKSSLNNKDVVYSSIGPNGEIPDQIVSKMIQSKKDKKLIRIYRGRNNSYFTSEIDAKKSYLNSHEGYYFNDVYFSSIEALKQYMEKNYEAIFDNTQNNKQFKVLQSPNGNVSNPIDPTSPNAKEQVTKFVKENYKEVYSIQKENTISYVSDTNPTELAKNLTLNDIDPVFLSKSEYGTYIVDTDVDDEYNFYGPYFYKGSSDIENITDKTLWHEVEPSDRDILTNNRENKFLENFFSMIVNDAENENELFSITYIEQETKEFNAFISSVAPAVWRKVLEDKKTLLKGKRYNPFVKIPILYSDIYDELVYNGYSSDVINRVRNYFAKVCEVYDQSLRALFPKEVITPEKQDWNILDKKDGLLSFKSLFGFNSRTFDYSFDISYYLDQIKLNFKKLFPVTCVAALAMENSYKFNGVFGFNYELLSTQIDSSLENRSKTAWEYVWELFSCNTLEKATVFFNKFSKSVSMNLDDFTKNTKAILSKNYTFFECGKALFLEELQQYKEGVPQYSLSMFKGIYNLPLLLSKVGTSYELFNIFREVTSLNDVYVSNNQSINNKLQYEQFVNLFHSLKNVEQAGSIESQNIQMVSNFFSSPTNSKTYNTFLKEYWNAPNYNANVALSEKIIDVLKRTVSIIDSIVSILKILSDSNIIKNLSKLFSSIPYLKVFSVVIDMCQFIIDAFVPRYERRSYIYKSGNTEFVWDGGLKSTIFFGLSQNQISSIDAMKILEPIKLTNSRPNDVYYLNGKTFEINQTNELIQEYTRLLSIGQVTSDKIKLNYTFYNHSNLNVNIKPNDIFDSVDQLAEYVYNYVFVQNKTDKFLADYQIYKFASGNINTTIPVTTNKQDAINKVTSLIKPTHIAMLPNLDKSNYPLTNNDSTLNDNSINSYILPGNSYDIKTGTIVSESEKPKNNRYIIIEPNMNIDSNSNSFLESSVNNTKKELENQFFNSFNVDSKLVYESDTVGINKFTDLSYQVNSYTMYKATSPYGETRYFLDKPKAFSWLMSKLDIKYIENKKEVTLYVYKDNQQVFYSIEDFNRWIKENTQVVSKG